MKIKFQGHQSTDREVEYSKDRIAFSTEIMKEMKFQ